jgi:hypothetical protein
MMHMRRLRGLLATIVGGALVGGASGAGLGLLFLLVPGPKTITVTPEFPGSALIVPAIWGAMTGAWSGAAFGALLLLAERGRGIDELRVHRVATWAAIASATAVRLGGWSWTAVALGSGLSAAIGAAATWLAKRNAARVAPGEFNSPPT